MWTTLEVEVMLRAYYRGEQGESPAHNSALGEFHSRGMLEWVDDDYPRRPRATDKGEAFVRRVLNTPEPKCGWVFDYNPELSDDGGASDGL